jgi:RimJ/RimL family protein N-acetyltransferase
MREEWYTVNCNQAFTTTVNTFAQNHPVPADHDVFVFKNTMSDDEIELYAPFDKYAYDNTIGTNGEESVDAQIASLKRDLAFKNKPIAPGVPLLYDFWYYYLRYDDETIGKANCKFFLGQPAIYEFCFFFITHDHRSKKLGMAFFCKVLSDACAIGNVQRIRLRILSTNLHAINLVTTLGFVKE